MMRTSEPLNQMPDAAPAASEVLAALGQKIAAKPKELLLHTLDDSRVEALGELCVRCPTEFDAS